MADGPLLVASDLDVHYGSSRALSGVSLTLPAGAMLAVLGPNGAGKSTLARALAGLVPVTAGTIELEGTDITKWSAHRRHRAGLTYVPEGRGIFPGLSVIDNLRMAVRGAGSRHQRQTALDRAITLFPILGERRHQRAGSLSGGEQQMLALARVLAIQPKVVIADEMSLGLAPLIVDAVFDALAEAKAAGIAVVLIEQFVHRALAMADHCAILARGELSWQGPASLAGTEVLDRYLGAVPA
jgi:branched-chain amino acid transport system ATP-binding protein